MNPTRAAAGLVLAAFIGWAVAATAPIPAAATPPPPTEATGTVFADGNANGRRDPGEKGLPGIRVSNQRDVVLTDPDGRWTLPVLGDDTIFFVIKPRGHMVPVDRNNLPRFYYIHKPNGSPKSRFAGVAPTGPLPASIDFALRPAREPDDFRAVFFGDPQPRNVKEVGYITRDVVEELIGVDAAFGITLGDIVFDDLSVMEPLTESIGRIGLPWWNVIGNHDLNLDAPDDPLSDETFERIYGPTYYAFDWGPVHFLVLDDVVYEGPPPPDAPRRGSRYHAGLGERQLAFIENDLKHVPEDKLLVISMHVPLPQIKDRQKLYRLIERRPNQMSISAHTHYQEHVFIGEKDDWRGQEEHHHLINVTVCGSWWRGAPDEQGIPHAMMRGGAPNGYSFIRFEKDRYSIRYKAARRPADHQLNIDFPDEVAPEKVAETPLLVNVFAGSKRSVVEARVDGRGPWKPLTKAAKKADPLYARARKREESIKDKPWGRLPSPIPSPHLWEGKLVDAVTPGLHVLHVRTTDMFGQTDTATKVFRVTGTPPADGTARRPAAPEKKPAPKPARPPAKRSAY